MLCFFLTLVWFGRGTWEPLKRLDWKLNPYWQSTSDRTEVTFYEVNNFVSVVVGKGTLLRSKLVVPTANLWASSEYLYLTVTASISGEDSNMPFVNLRLFIFEGRQESIIPSCRPSQTFTLLHYFNVEHNAVCKSLHLLFTLHLVLLFAKWPECNTVNSMVHCVECMLLSWW